jgi:sugar phosphate isomerase/epimerase
MVLIKRFMARPGIPIPGWWAILMVLIPPFPLVGSQEVADVPPLGVGGGLEVADQVKVAGGSFVASSVAGWLDPDGPEEAFLERVEAAKQAALPILSCNSFIRRKDLKCVGPKANHAEVLAYAERAFDRARRAGVKGITFGSSGSRRIPEGFSKDEAKRQFVELLKLMGPAAESHGVMVMVEPLRKKECNFLNTIGEVAEVVRAANHPYIRANADLYHMVIEGDTPEDLQKAVDLVEIVEIAEAEGRRVPGVGGQDFRPFFKVLKEAGFKGGINIEGKWEVSELKMGFAEITRQWNES